jgi:hypothetical protein
MVCQNCFREAETKKVKIYRNIGAIVLRFPGHIEGNLCKDCINKYFWKYSLICFFLGWWGIISFFTNIYFLINNLVVFIQSMQMIYPNSEIIVDTYKEDVIKRIDPFIGEIITKLNESGASDELLTDIARKANVKPGHVYIYIQNLLALAKKTKK